MPETPWSKFRLNEHTVADLDALAAGLGGVRSVAVRDAIHYWHDAVLAAGRRNAEALAKEEWSLLAHLNNPRDLDLPDHANDDRPTRDWCHILATELHGMHEGRTALLVSQKEEIAAGKRLAKKISGWGIARGYALYLCLCHFWGPALDTPGDGEWWHPETWMTPTARSD